MSNRKIFTLVLSLFILLGASSLYTSTNVFSSDDSLRQMMYAFASDDYNGRLPGTKEDTFCQSDIYNFYVKNNIKPYKNEYYHTYTHISYEANEELSLNYNNQSEVLINGADYLISNRVNNINFKDLPVYDLNKASASSTPCAALLDNHNDIKNIIGLDTYKNIVVILLKENNFKRHLDVNEDGTPIVQLNKEIYSNLISENSSLSISTKYTPQEIEVNNVIGQIKGTDQSKCIVLSAHFDHVGAINDIVFNGAIDNVSGTYAMLSLSEKLSKYYSNSSPDYDIILANFNGEESGLQGSKAFIEEISNNYDDIININFDCIGIKSNEEYLVIGDDHYSTELSTIILEFYNDLGYQIEISDMYTSDHESFIENNIAAITIGQEPNNQLHSSDDDIENIEFTQIDTLVNDLFKLVTNSSKTLVTSSHHCEEDGSTNDELTSDVMEQIEAVQNELEYGTYKYISIDDDVYLIDNTSTSFTKFDELKTPNYTIDSNNIQILYDMTFYDGRIYNDIILYTDEDIDYDKTYTIDLDKNMVEDITLRYKNNNNEGIELRISELQTEDELSDGLVESEKIVNGTPYKYIYDPTTNKLVDFLFEFTYQNKVYYVSTIKGMYVDLEIEGTMYTILNSNMHYDNNEEIRYDTIITKEFIQNVIDAFFSD